jgi:hypothetical protein
MNKKVTAQVTQRVLYPGGYPPVLKDLCQIREGRGT